MESSENGMGPMPHQDLNSSYISLHNLSQRGFSLIALIGVLAVITISLSLATPTFVKIFEREHQEVERLQLRRIADGIQQYLEQNKAFPPALTSLVPDYVPFSTAQASTNAHGFPRHYAIHPAMVGFNNNIGLSTSELVNARFLLLSNLTQDVAPTITTLAEFETWWGTNESATPGLHINRENVGKMFHQLTIDQNGDGGSYELNSSATHSGGGPLTLHSNYHLMGTTIGFDEADSYSAPEVQFALTTNTTYWFDPNCTVGKRWNPMEPNCGSIGSVRDEFNAIAYNGNDGTQSWATDWQESGEADGPTSGKMQVVTDAQCAAGNCFQFGGGGGGPPTSVNRETDLSGASSATLTFSYLRTAGGNGGNISVQISGDGGVSWTNLQTYTMNGSDISQVPQTFDLTAYIAANTQVQFVRSGNVNRFLLADNIEISWN